MTISKHILDVKKAWPTRATEARHSFVKSAREIALKGEFIAYLAKDRAQIFIGREP